MRYYLIGEYELGMLRLLAWRLNTEEPMSSDEMRDLGRAIEAVHHTCEHHTCERLGPGAAPGAETRTEGS